MHQEIAQMLAAGTRSAADEVVLSWDFFQECTHEEERFFFGGEYHEISWGKFEYPLV
jgi:hypothetical protein